MEESKEYPRILFVSSNAFSTRNANGRVMEQLVRHFPDNKLSMIYFTGEDPDIKFESSYLKITDREKLKYFFNKRNLGTIIKPGETTLTNNQHKRKHGTHNGLSLLIREFIWKHGRWDKTNVDEFVRDNKPDVIFLNASRNIFVIEMAIYIQRKFNLPIIVYTTEDEYFHHPFIFNIFNYVFYKNLRKEYKKLYKNVSNTIAFHKGLKEKFDKEFNINSSVIHMSTKINESTPDINKNVFVYGGNVDRGRDITLCYIADALKNISSDYKLKIICSNSNKINKVLFKKENVEIIESIPYKQFIKELNSSPIVFNIESFRKKDKKLIGATFSCKTADLLATNSPVLIIGPMYCYCVKYFAEKADAVFVATTLNDVEPMIKKIINNYDTSTSFVQKAHELVNKEFNVEKNEELFLNIVREAVRK